METKILIWGTGKEFWELYNILMMNEELGNFKILGYVNRETGGKRFAGKELFHPDELVGGIWFDYIIVATSAY